MGLLAIRKRVILPSYKPTDHTPAFYIDPHSGRLIPTAYFLKNLDVIGPQHWQNYYTADFRLRVVRTTGVQGSTKAEHNHGIINEFSCCHDGSDQSDLDMESDDEEMIIEHECHQQQQVISSQPQYTIKQSPPCYFVHTLVLITQSGFFNQLLGQPAKLPESITVHVPYPEAFEPILHWLYHHDDDAWLDQITLENFPKFYVNVCFLKLGREAYDVLDTFIEEVEEAGLDIDYEGVLEVC